MKHIQYLPGTGLKACRSQNDLEAQPDSWSTGQLYGQSVNFM